MQLVCSESFRFLHFLLWYPVSDTCRSHVMVWSKYKITTVSAAPWWASQDTNSAGGKRRCRRQIRKSLRNQASCLLHKFSLWFFWVIVKYVNNYPDYYNFFSAVLLLIIYCFLFLPKGFTDLAEMRRKSSGTRKEASSVNDHPIIGRATCLKIFLPIYLPPHRYPDPRAWPSTDCQASSWSYLLLLPSS